MPTLVGKNEQFLEGFDIVTDAVKRTLGAEGRLAVLENEQHMAPPKITKDGVSVARHITETHPVKFQGAALAKQAAIKTLVEVGDNTTTTLVLAQALVKEVPHFNKKVEFGIEKAYEDAQRLLKKYAKPVNKKTVKAIATVSANNDKKIGEIVAQAYEQSGQGEGIIDSIQSQKEKSVSLKVSEGLKVQKGWFHPALINNEQKGTFEAENCLIVVYEGWEPHLSMPLKRFILENRNLSPILIIAERVGDTTYGSETLAQMVRANVNISLVEAPGFEDTRVQNMMDIALYTGAKVFRQGQDEKIEAGRAEKVTVGMQTTSIINPRSEEVTKKLEELKANLEDPDTEKDEFNLKERIKFLEGKSVTVVVGGDIEMEASEVFDRVDDAIKAVKSVLLEGWVAGGGSTLAHISHKMNRSFENADVREGYEAFRRSLLYPMKQICFNANREPEEHLKKAFEIYGWGYNGSTDETSNLIKDSIIDSKKGLSVAMKNAKATAILLLNVDVISTINQF